MLTKKKLLGVEVTDATKEEILEYVVENVEKKGKSFYVVTPNPEFLVLANKDKSFKSTLNHAEIALADGVGLTFYAQLVGKPLKERVTGVDFVEMLCKEIAKRPITAGFLGGRGKIAEMTAECLSVKYPGLKIVFTGSEWPKGRINDKRLKIKEKEISNHKSPIPNQPIDVLFVAFGFPKQEKWMEEHLNSNIYRVAVGVGGAFDYISGSVARAPRLIRLVGLEWLFRLIVQPWRWRRQLALIDFVGLTIKEKLSL